MQNLDSQSRCLELYRFCTANAERLSLAGRATFQVSINRDAAPQSCALEGEWPLRESGLKASLVDPEKPIKPL
jgi:hypothetical protein